MTLRRKILFLIFSLTFLIILAMSGTYYSLFNTQLKEHSHNQVVTAFDLVFDDLDTRTQDSIAKITRFIDSSLASPMYVMQLFQDQYAQREQAWSVREVRKLVPQLSTITSEIRKFGDLIGATEILIYDKQQTLLALYQQHGEELIIGGYLPKVVEGELIPFQPDDEWFTSLMNVEEIPRQALPAGISSTYQEDIPTTTRARLNTRHDRLMLTFVAPILQKEELGGVCVIHVGISQQDVERYSRLSGTKVNLFVGTTLSVGALPEYTTLSEDTQGERHAIDLQTLQDRPPIIFSEAEVDQQAYYQGMLVIGDKEDLLGAIAVHFPRQRETESRRSFILLVISITLVFGVLTTGGALLLSAIIARPIKRLSELLQQLTQGDLRGIGQQLSGTFGRSKGYAGKWTWHASKKTKDEFVLLFYSFHAMIDYLLDMANVADRISRGEITQEVTPRSEKDVLGNAFHRMTLYLKTIASVATAVADGDLRHDIHPQTEHDVLGQAFHRMNSLRHIMSEITREADQLKKMAEDLNQISITMVADAKKSSLQAQDVLSSSQQVNQNVSEVSTATSQMASSIREISRNAHDVAKVVSTAVKTANSANTTIAELEIRSQEIGNIIKVITTITQQTNLLALNATIEAARAGDSGKGFAVVANEVKDLAGEIARSAEDITDKVEAIQASIGETTEALSKMSKDIERIDSSTNVIVSAVTEQAATTDVITRSLADAAQGTNEVTHVIADVAAVAQNSSDIAMHVQSSAENQAAVAERLQQLISTFKI